MTEVSATREAGSGAGDRPTGGGFTKEQQDERRELLYSLLGDLPPRSRRVSAELVGVEEREWYILEKLLLDLNGMEPVPAYFVRPKQPAAGGTAGAAKSGRWPVVLFNHSHGGRYEVGKEELLQGNTYLVRPPYAEELAKAGIAALAIDAWNFGERRGRTESELFKEMLWQGRVLWGMMVYDSIKAVDYLHTRDDVDTERIATLGMSMGSTMSWWTAALDTRIKVCIDICGLTDFHELIAARGLDGHGIYYYVPSLLKHFTTGEINALIAPRPHLSLAGNYDRLTPAAGLDRLDAYLREVYASWGRPEAWKMLRFGVGHVETQAMRKAAMDFLARWL